MLIFCWLKGNELSTQLQTLYSSIVAHWLTWCCLVLQLRKLLNLARKNIPHISRRGCIAETEGFDALRPKPGHVAFRGTSTSICQWRGKTSSFFWSAPGTPISKRKRSLPINCCSCCKGGKKLCNYSLANAQGIQDA